MKIVVDERGNVTPSGTAERFAVPMSRVETLEGRGVPATGPGTPIYRGVCAHTFEAPTGQRTRSKPRGPRPSYEDGELRDKRIEKAQDPYTGSVRLTCQWLPRQGFIFRQPKSFRSTRPVALSITTAERLRLHRLQQIEERLAAGLAYSDEGLVFTNAAAQPVHPSTLRVPGAGWPTRQGLDGFASTTGVTLTPRYCSSRGYTRR